MANKIAKFINKMSLSPSDKRLLKSIFDQMIADGTLNKTAFDSHTHQTEGIFDMGLSKAGLAIHGVNTENVLTANAFDFSIAGVAYQLAAQAEIDISGLSFTPTELATAKQRIYLIHVASGGTIDILEGEDHASDAQIPATPAGKVALGYIKVVNASGSGFTIGTTALDTAGITDTYVDLAGNAAGGQELVISKPGSDTQEVDQGTASTFSANLTTG